MQKSDNIEDIIYNEVTEMKNSKIFPQESMTKNMSNTDINDLKNINLLVIKLVLYSNVKCFKL